MSLGKGAELSWQLQPSTDTAVALSGNLETNGTRTFGTGRPKRRCTATPPFACTDVVYARRRSLTFLSCYLLKLSVLHGSINTTSSRNQQLYFHQHKRSLSCVVTEGGGEGRMRGPGGWFGSSKPQVPKTWDVCWYWVVLIVPPLCRFLVFPTPPPLSPVWPRWAGEVTADGSSIFTTEPGPYPAPRDRTHTHSLLVMVMNMRASTNATGG